jgi:hypothetical protein
MLVMGSPQRESGVRIESVHAVGVAQFGCDLDEWRHTARRKPGVECRDVNRLSEKRRLARKLAECRPLPTPPLCEADELCVTPCPVFVGRCEEKGICEVPFGKECRPRRPRNIERILMERAYLGLLTRMWTFDWQVTHGHVLGIKNGRYFDIFV